MILQALNRYYDRVDSLPREGWVRRGVDYVVVLDEQGGCVNLEAVGEQRKGKTIPRDMLVTAIGKQAMKHANSGKDANLLWDNASFVFGTGNKGDIKLANFVQTLSEWFGKLNDPGVEAIRRFCVNLQTNPAAAAALIERFQAKNDFDKRDPVLIFRLVTDLMSWNQSPWIGTLRLIPGARRARLLTD
ncbi:type I-C CRISPR-associated protein Cas8c/Csd1 [Acidithiobacillus sulfuriphilus]|uniref:type I-C CRISPR-associated protein Cas8c/Csd1 n=1 Tax=Acidithiobacillus sulfuriphilus TaxID=1867749 RepID=UPI003F5FA014